MTLSLFPAVLLSSCRTVVSRITGGEKEKRGKGEFIGEHEEEGWKGGGAGQGKEKRVKRITHKQRNEERAKGSY